jgi:hypothetical protein
MEITGLRRNAARIERVRRNPETEVRSASRKARTMSDSRAAGFIPVKPRR